VNIEIFIFLKNPNSGLTKRNSTRKYQIKPIVLKSKSTKKENAESFFHKSAFFILLVFTIIILPLVHTFKIMDPVLMIRLLVLAIFLTIFILIYFNPKSILKFKTRIIQQPVFVIWAGYLLVSAAALAIAINFREGLFDVSKTAVILIFTLVLSIVLFNKKDWMEILPVMVSISAVMACILGFSQYFDKVYLKEHLEKVGELPLIYEVKGLMAHKNQFSISLFLMLPFIGYGIYRFSNWRRWLSILAFIMVSVLLILLKTRAVWLGGIFATLVTLVILILGYTQFGLTRKIRNYIVFGSGTIFIIISLILVFGGNNQYIDRLRSVTKPGSHDNKYRLMIWESSVRMAADYPVLGVGPGNWQFNLPDYLKGKDFRKDQLNWIRPHNDYLWVLTEKGIIGLLLYLSVFVLIIIKALRIIRNQSNIHVKTFALLVIFGLTGYLVDAFFDFPYERINQQVYLSLFFACLLVMGHQNDDPLKKNGSIRFFLLPAIPILVFAVVFGLQAIKLESHILKARVALLQNRNEVVLKEGLAAQTALKNLDAEAVPVNWFIGLGYYNRGETSSAIKHYEMAKKENPVMINVLNNLGQAYFKIKDYENAEKNYLAALDILPTYREALFNISSLYYAQKKYVKSLSALQLLQRNSVTRDQEVENRIKHLNLLIEDQ